MNVNGSIKVLDDGVLDDAALIRWVELIKNGCQSGQITKLYAILKKVVDHHNIFEKV